MTSRAWQSLRTGKPATPALWTLFSALLLLAVIFVTWLGVSMRESTWQQTTAVRYVPDMINAWTWGSRAAGERWGGYFGIYDTVVARAGGGNEYGLDYVPLRLAVMTQWAGEERRKGVRQWQNTRELNAPLMRVNYAMDAVSALSAWGITTTILLHRRRKNETLGELTGFEGWGISPMGALTLGLLAGALVWLNPAMHVSAFGRPTWDVWVVTFYLLACWAMVAQKFFLAGLALAVGAMFKGQQFAVIAFFVPWALLVGSWAGVLSWACGFVAGIGLVTWPWLIGSAGDRVGWGWLSLIVVASLATGAGGWFVGKVWKNRTLWTGRGVVWGFALALASVAAYRISTGSASLSWFEVAFRYGSQKFGQLEVGGSMCLAGILANRYGWGAYDEVFPGVTMTQLLAFFYGACAITCGLAAGWAARFGDPRRVLIAIPAVWICFFAYMSKMHERYLLWGAVAAALCVGRSLGLTILGLILSAASWAMTLRVMILNSPTKSDYRLLGLSGEEVQRLIDPMIPDAGWGVMAAAAVFLWMTVVPWKSAEVKGKGP